MKRQFFSILTVGLLAGLANAQPPKVEPPQATPATPAKVEPKTDFSKIFKSDQEKIGYAIGMNTGGGLKGRLKSLDIAVDNDALVKGFNESFGAGPTLITEEQEKEILAEVNKEIQSKMAEKRKAQAEEQRLKGEKNKVDGPAFLAKNKTEPGVVTLPSGLQYKVITEGTGPMPTAQDEVTVNYRGTLIDGTEFDSSAKRNRPLTTKVTGSIIPGWTQVLQLMKAGSKWQVFIPSELGYGANPHGPIIAGSSVLIFDLELISVQASTGAPTANPAPAAAPGAPLTSDIIKVPSAEEIKKGAKIETIKAEDIEKEKAKQKP